jgi:small-conductance mechanosensitive channel
MKIKEILEYEILTVSTYTITPVTIIGIILTVILSRIVLRMTLRFLRNSNFMKNRLDRGRRYALEQFIRYLIYAVTFLLIAQNIGIDLSLIWAGSAALLVGIGLGLQQIFNDLASGVILLIEGEIEVGDVVVIDGTAGKIQKISIRASHIETADKVTMVVPNSQLITNNVANHGASNIHHSRFRVNIGVAYGTNTKLVKKLLLQVAEEHDLVSKNLKPVVVFADFGASSLDFQLQFYSNELLYIEAIKSDLRFRIDEVFRQNNIEIPFPQRDIWIKNKLTIHKDSPPSMAPDAISKQ